MKTRIPKKGNEQIQLKVMDFSIWNGIKFGFGFMIGSAAFSLCLFVFGIVISFILAMLGMSLGMYM